MHSRLLRWLTFALGAGFVWPAGAQDVLPFPPKPSGRIARGTMQESTYSPLPPEKHLPKDAPNILIVLIDDVGPAQTDTYGGEIHTPTLSRIAREGISYNRFHTTAMCSPTRAALLTGRNHHRVASGQITELANDWDGYMGTIPKSSATVAEVLKDYGYHTAAWGKWHNSPADQTTAAGPFDYWPTGSGFEYFYGFVGGEASQYEPMLSKHGYVDIPGSGGTLLSPERGHRRRRDPVAARAEGLRAGQAVLHVLGAGRLARPAPGHEGVGRQVQGQVRRRLGQVPRARLPTRQAAGLDSAERAVNPATGHPCFLGLDPRDDPNRLSRCSRFTEHVDARLTASLTDRSLGFGRTR
jgi:hypothetical protein